MPLASQRVAQAADQLIELGHDFVTARVIHGRFARCILWEGVMNRGNGTRFCDLRSNSVECRFQPAQSCAGILVFRHEPLVYRLCHWTACISTGQANNVKDFAYDLAHAGGHYP